MGNTQIPRFARTMISLLLVSVLILIGCNSVNEDAEKWFVVSGHITDSLTGLPIDSATIRARKRDSTLSSVLWYSDSTGRYGVVIGGPELTLVVGKTGYSTQERQFDDLSPGYPGIDFKLVKQ